MPSTWRAPSRTPATAAPVPRTDIPAPGESVLATLKLGVHMMREGEFISDHDVKVANWVAYVLCGGKITPGTPVSEQYLLDLEREAFLSLCGEKKTQERIAFTLKTGQAVEELEGETTYERSSDCERGANRGGQSAQRECCGPRVPDDLGAAAIQGALERVPGLDKAEVEDVIIGCAMPEAEQGMNVARICALRAGMPIESAAMTINRYCASGLQSIALAAERIRGGGADVIVAGGTESMSLVPMGGNKISINPALMEQYPDSYLSMGLTAERVAQHYGISREQADEFALREPSEGAGRAGRGAVRAGDRAGAGHLHRSRREVEAEEDRDRVQGR